MINDFRKATLTDYGHQLFLVIASIVLTGWIIRLSGGDPLLLFKSFYSVISSSAFLWLVLDLAGILLIASAGSSMALEGGVYNTGAEGQFIAGFAVAGIVFANAGDGVLFLSLAGGALVGTCLMALVLQSLVPRSGLMSSKCRENLVIRGLLSNFIVLGALGSFIVLPVKTFFFPLFQAPSSVESSSLVSQTILSSLAHPSSVLFLALALYGATKYILVHLQFGLTLRSGVNHMSLYQRLFFSLLTGGLCGVSGAALFLCGPSLISTIGFVEGIGTLSFAIAFAARGGLWLFLLPLTFVYSVIATGWDYAAFGNQSIMAAAIALLLVVSIVPLKDRGESS